MAGAAATEAAAFPRPLAAKLAKLGIARPLDLVLHLPLRYEDETRITPIARARPGLACQIEARVVEAKLAYRPKRQLVARVRDESGELVLRFLHFYPSQAKQLAPDARVRAFGEVRGGFWGAEMVHPRVRVARDEPLPEGLTPVYPTTAGLSQPALRKLIEAALQCEPLQDSLPESLRERLDLIGFPQAVRLLHHPPPETDPAILEQRLAGAWRRIKFDELLAQQLSLRLAYRRRRGRSAPALAAAGHLTGRLLAALPFRLTGAQERAWAEISAELAASHPMQRMLQGDVGSGKTIVAGLAMLQAAENGWQAALMAPTEILAEQHWRKLSAWMAPLGIPVAWLSGSQKKREREPLRAALAAGEILLAVGTHALIEDEVTFPRLALAVVDEQHRFGVRQRLALRHKAESPHQLMMTATPIPRTLAMSYYADLDVSVLDELPPGRSPVVTKLVADTRRDEVIERIREACRAGRQAYWVCPLIEESETLELQTAIDTHARLTAELPGLGVGLLHGRLPTEEKSAVMEAFSRGEVQVLVATTVVEVGVDVPNASLMVIEHAERFGLSQLHQLRGRVGRGSAQSACILLYQGPLSETARERLKAIHASQDGFEIARRDMALRGPGEFLGSRQSGVPLLRYADLALDEDLVEQARATAEILWREHPDAARAHLERWLAGRADYLHA